MEVTHYCKVCFAMWQFHTDGTCSLRSKACGPCCDNVPMGDQIVALRAPQAVAPSEGEIEQAITDLCGAVEFDITELEASEESDETKEAKDKLRALMRRAAAQAPSSGNDKLRREIQAEIDRLLVQDRASANVHESGISGAYVLNSIAAILEAAEPSEPAAADGFDALPIVDEEIALVTKQRDAEAAYSVTRDAYNIVLSTLKALRAAIAKAREATR